MEGVILIIVLVIILCIIVLVIIKSANCYDLTRSSYKNEPFSSMSKLPPLYIVYSISNSPYQEWQADLLDFSVAQSGQPGKIVRIVSKDPKYPDRPMPRSRNGITLETEDFSKYGGGYSAMNKPGGLRELHKVVTDKSAVIVLLDPDMIFTRVWDPTALVKEGVVYGQRWHGYGEEYCRKTTPQKYRDYCPPTDEKAIMYPFAMTMGTLEKIIPKYFESSAYYSTAKDWMTEMSALAIAQNDPSLGLKIITVANIGITNDWPKHNQDPDAPIMHYCQTIKDKSGKEIWGKRRYNAWDPVPDPKEATTRVDREVLEMIRIARAKLK